MKQTDNSDLHEVLDGTVAETDSAVDRTALARYTSALSELARTRKKAPTSLKGNVMAALPASRARRRY